MSSSQVFASFRDPADPVVAEYDLALTSSTVSELAEARRTTYHSGRWIWDDQNGETSISITGPHVTLPSNGDCSAYYSWVEEKSGNQGPGTEFTDHHCHSSVSQTLLKHCIKQFLSKENFKIYVFKSHF